MGKSLSLERGMVSNIRGSTVQHPRDSHRLRSPYVACIDAYDQTDIGSMMAYMIAMKVRSAHSEYTHLTAVAASESIQLIVLALL